MSKSINKKKRNAFEYFNMDLYGSLPTAGKEQMPVLEPFIGAIPDRLLSFEEAYSKKITDCGVHFYLNDEHFIRVFNHPDKYLPFLRDCMAVIGPDLSQYIDLPPAVRYAHSYYNRALSAYWQDNDVRVIPNVTWSRPDSYGYSFVGLPHESVIAINCNGILCHDVTKYLWNRGYEKAISILNPSHIIRYGTKMECDKDEISSYFCNERLKSLRYGRERQQSKRMA